MDPIAPIYLGTVESSGDGSTIGLYRRHNLPQPKNLRKISFSIPAQKICSYRPIKTKLFPKHIVDEEIAAEVVGGVTEYVFEDEKSYYADLQSAKFGITTRRAGWDCLRHYEIAANYAVICFRDLDKKPMECAPHGLIPGVNCISYGNFKDLLEQINNIDNEAYEKLQMASIEWIMKNTTLERAKELITHFDLQHYI
jgi:hypothetical protein